MWNKLTDKERLIWRQKAIKLRKKGSKGMISTGFVPKQKPISQTVTPRYLNKVQAQPYRISNNSDASYNSSTISTIVHKKEVHVPVKGAQPQENGAIKVNATNTSVKSVSDNKPIDVASYLALLGDSLQLIGDRLREHEVSANQPTNN